jgi:hypothetical protein
MSVGIGGGPGRLSSGIPAMRSLVSSDSIAFS